MRNKIFLLSIVSILFVYCGGGETGPTAPPEPVNTAPSVPVLNSPTNNKLCISNIVVFEWSASTDSEKNPITYQLQVATDNQFAQIVNTSEVSGTTQSVTLDKGKAYYWRVKATDSKNASSSYSTVYSFYTEGVALSNHLPFIPELISPVNNAILNTTAPLSKNPIREATSAIAFTIFEEADACRKFKPATLTNANTNRLPVPGPIKPL